MDLLFKSEQESQGIKILFQGTKLENQQLIVDIESEQTAQGTQIKNQS